MKGHPLHGRKSANVSFWQLSFSWFQREVLFLEAESGKIIEETFDSLIKSDLAVHSLKQLKSKNLREVKTCSTYFVIIARPGDWEEVHEEGGLHHLEVQQGDRRC